MLTSYPQRKVKKSKTVAAQAARGGTRRNVVGVACGRWSADVVRRRAPRKAKVTMFPRGGGGGVGRSPLRKARYHVSQQPRMSESSLSTRSSRVRGVASTPPATARTPIRHVQRVHNNI